MALLLVRLAVVGFASIVSEAKRSGPNAFQARNIPAFKFKPTFPRYMAYPPNFDGMIA